MNREEWFKDRANLILERFNSGAICELNLWRQCNDDLPPDEHKRVFLILGFVPFAGYPLVRMVDKTCGRCAMPYKGNPNEKIEDCPYCTAVPSSATHNWNEQYHKRVTDRRF